MGQLPTPTYFHQPMGKYHAIQWPVEVALGGLITWQSFKGPQPAIDALELLAHVQALRRLPEGDRPGRGTMFMSVV